jgi:hypothetical protein
VNIFNEFQLSIGRLFGKLETECRPRAVLEAASLTSVALPARLSLDLNNSPTPKQLGLHLKFCFRLNSSQEKVVFFVHEAIRHVAVAAVCDRRH